MKDLFFKMILSIAVVYIVINIFSNIAINKRYIDISKTDSSEILRDYEKYYILSDIIKGYNNYILNDKFNELSNITLFDAKKDKEFYSELKNKSLLTSNSNIKIDNIKVLSDDVYRCNYSIISENIETDISLVIRLDEATFSYKIINIGI